MSTDPGSAGGEPAGSVPVPDGAAPAALDRDVERFLRHLAIERGRSANTLAAYRHDLLAYAEHLDGSPAAQATPEHVQSFVRALRERGASLLPAGVRAVDGAFHAGDAVEVFAEGAAQPFAKGIVQYDAGELRRVLGRSSAELPALLGYQGPDTVIHRDDLVLL